MIYNFKRKFLKIYHLFSSLSFLEALNHFASIGIQKIGKFPGFISYSQTGEDQILSFLLREEQNGFYLDIGCNHPIKLSNSYNFYLRGWKGICVDANSELIKKFKVVKSNVPRRTYSKKN